MEAIKFKECNSDYAENQDEYITLPAHKTKDGQGQVTTCWKLSLGERCKLLFSGKIYLQILTFNNPLQPLKMSIEKPYTIGGGS